MSPGWRLALYYCPPLAVFWITVDTPRLVRGIHHSIDPFVHTIFGLIGFIVDAGTGANMQLKPDPMRAKLAPIGSDENSIIFDVRVEGGGKENAVMDTECQAEPASDTTTGLKRLPREFGVVGVEITETSVEADTMSDPHGIMISDVLPDGAAAKSGLKVGDIIQSINSNRISNKNDIRNNLDDMLAGETAIIVIWRDRELYETEVVF